MSILWVLDLPKSVPPVLYLLISREVAAYRMCLLWMLKLINAFVTEVVIQVTYLKYVYHNRHTPFWCTPLHEFFLVAPESM